MNYLYLNENYFVVYQRQGNNANGNPLFIINFFYKYFDRGQQKKTYSNYNVCILGQRRDKHNNIKLESYNIEADIIRIFETTTKP